MECPHACPPGLYPLMCRCWEWNADLRPTFCQIHAELESVYLELDRRGSDDVDKENVVPTNNDRFVVEK